MATHSSILAWRIPWTEEPGGLHGVTKNRKQLSTNACRRELNGGNTSQIIFPDPGLGILGVNGCIL